MCVCMYVCVCVCLYVHVHRSDHISFSFLFSVYCVYVTSPGLFISVGHENIHSSSNGWTLETLKWRTS